MSTKPLLLLSAFCALSISLTGCGDGQDRNNATIKATATVPVDVGKAKQELDHVVGALRNMRDASDSADLKKLDAEVKHHTSSLDGALSDVDASSRSAVTAGKNQVQAWHKQADGFTDADLRNASSRREGDLRTAVDALSTSRDGFVTVSQDFSSKVKQAVTALDLDLTQPGVLSIKPTLSRIVDDEASVRSSLNDIADKSRTVNAMLNPQTTEPLNH
jgi:hypothetical protein